MLDDLLEPGLKLVVCGTAAGLRSALSGQYYAGRGNRFWGTLAEIGLTSRRLEPSEFRLLRTFGIGLTDLIKDQAGMDWGIAFSSTAARELRQRIVLLRPQVLCFNGKRAAKEFFQTKDVAFGLQNERVCDTRLFVAPSTSGAAGKSWDRSQWEALADIVRANDHSLDGSEN